MQISYVGNNSNSLMNNGTTQAVVLDNVNAVPVGTLYTQESATKINMQSVTTIAILQPALPSR
jgi:hypothetical protein